MTDLTAPHHRQSPLPPGVIAIGLALASWVVLVGGVWFAINGLLLA